MRRFIIATAIACAALASCTKDVENAKSDLNEISFNNPVISPVSKAKEINGTTFPTAVDFSVYAWYGDVAYMDNVTVTYDGTIDDTTVGAGAWRPENTYYWPKNGTLDFDAYSPSSVKASATKEDGIAVTGFEASTDPAKEIDFLYSARITGKSSSIEETNDTYDGVNIPFKHALSVIRFTAKTAGDYGDYVKIKEITVKDINNIGDFKTNAWSNQSGTVTRTIFNDTQVITSTTTAIGETAIVLPQNLESSTKTVEVKYTIKHGEHELEQLATYAFTGSWEQGTRYTYAIIIGLDRIYFAPSVTDWVDVTPKFEVEI